MHIHLVSLFPEIFESFLATSLIQKAQTKGILKFSLHNPREYCQDKHQQIDDQIYGGGEGMLIKAQPIIDCVEAIIQQFKIKKSDFIKATKECPYSYEEKDGKCIKTTVSEVGYECKNGTLSGNTCITIDTKDLIKSCPKGSKVQNDKCITEQNTTCQNNEKLINSDCYTTTEVKTECATNQELYKNRLEAIPEPPRYIRKK